MHTSSAFIVTAPNKPGAQCTTISYHPWRILDGTADERCDTATLTPAK
jgi:hypothetical protein